MFFISDLFVGKIDNIKAIGNIRTTKFNGAVLLQKIIFLFIAALKSL